MRCSIWQVASQTIIVRCCLNPADMANNGIVRHPTLACASIMTRIGEFSRCILFRTTVTRLQLLMAMRCDSMSSVTRSARTLTIASWCWQTRVSLSSSAAQGDRPHQTECYMQTHTMRQVRLISNPQLNIAREIRVTMGTCGPQMVHFWSMRNGWAVTGHNSP